MSGGQERSEAPTPKKLREARREGRIGRSADLGAWLGVGAAAALLPSVLERGREACLRLLAAVPEVAAAPEPAAATRVLAQGLGDAATVVAPLAAVGVAVAVGAAAAQGGIHPATKALKPQLKRLNPVQGFKRILGPQAGWEALKTLLKTSVVALVLWWTVGALTPTLVASGSLPLAETIDGIRGGAAALLRAGVAAGLALAVLDLVVVRRRTNKQLRLTKREVKDENKQSEGDPLLKGAIRSRQIAMSRNRMMAEVARADVVLVNPTHVAVALRYEPARGAPRVVAKGAGLVAARIRERATEHRVPMVEDVPLARALHSRCELNQEIPAELYEAVARILAFVMALRRRGSAAGTHRVPAAAVHGRARPA
jgi:flagellar biosynthetic protein FlhB